MDGQDWVLPHTLQRGPDRAVEKDSFKLKCAPPPTTTPNSASPPLLPTGPPHGAHFGMNVCSVRRQPGREGGGGVAATGLVFMRDRGSSQARYRRGGPRF